MAAHETSQRVAFKLGFAVKCNAYYFRGILVSVHEVVY